MCQHSCLDNKYWQALSADSILKIHRNWLQHAHYIIPGTRHCWLKSKQFCPSQNTPKRCISHSNTHLDPLIKCPKQKITQPLHLHINSQHFQALGPAVFVPFTAHCQKSIHFNQKCLQNMHCQKLYLVLRSKNAAICAYTDNSEKLLSGPFPIRQKMPKNIVL